jgi:indolepyruvate ferredoxin oxidoreductase
VNALSNIALSQLSLASRYTAECGTVFLSGMQAMLRVMLDQARADRRGGIRTAGLISGYPGSPLGGVDSEIMRNRAVFEAGSVYHQLGLNEELAATAIYGTQLIHDVPGAKFDGVFGMWFGKAPGVDRAADALHHANFHGVARNGGVLAVAGDDPHARSTILPSDSNVIFSSFYMPVLAPGNIQEVLDFGRHGFALSRASGLWVGFKLVSDVADSIGTAEIDLDRVRPIVPSVEFQGRPFVPEFRANDAGPVMLEREREIFYGRLEIARCYARVNGLNKIVGAGKDGKRGILVSGKTYYELREALRSLGFDDDALNAAGIRILKLGMVYPFDQETALEFSEGLRDILVIEDKRPLLEGLLKETLYGRSNAPKIVGKNDSEGRLLLTACGELSSDAIRTALARWIGIEVASNLGVSSQNSDALPVAALPEVRTPYFCSGCPHNRSLKVPEGSVVGAGIGCHIMTLWMGKVFGEVAGYTQMGGEGAQWVGLSRFTETNHFYQNLGDGTFTHSGSLAIRFAVAANVNVTYKILYNSAVAMTGGQPVYGGKTVEGIVRELTAEGVKRIVITTDDLPRYEKVNLGGLATVRHRDDLVEVEKELAILKGVTVVINDQQCAAELRRMRKRGQRKQRKLKVLINERICEGCGDCGVKSNCLSVEPVETEFGRKTRINQSSCNQDYSCLAGDCPSFMTIEGGSRLRAPIVADPPVVLEQPVYRVPEENFSVFMAGIGGTGVITVNQILGMAAALSGRSVRAIDQIGSSQKAGPVASHLHVTMERREGATRIMSGCADVMLAFDLLSAVDSGNLLLADARRTVLVANIHEVPTGGTVTDITRKYPNLSLLRGRIASVVKDGAIFLDSLELSRRIFDNEVAANMILVGAAFQSGALPLPVEAIEAAIRMNGVSVESNLRAFAWGRFMVQCPGEGKTAISGHSADDIVLATVEPELASALSMLKISPELEERIRIRTAELCAYQDVRYAKSYLDFLQTVTSREKQQSAHREEIARAVALNLYKLMAYKDEYEVARLMVDGYIQQRESGEIGHDQQVSWLVHPTFLRVLGVKKKVRLGKWFIPIARVLAAAKVVRGTRFDLLAGTRVRRLERSLPSLYRDTMLEGLKHLNPQNYQRVLALADLPDMIRGYEDIKLRNFDEFNRRLSLILAELRQSSGPSAPPREDRIVA